MIKGLIYMARTLLFVLTVFLTITVIVGLLMKTGTVSLLVKNQIERSFEEEFNGRIDIWKVNINFPIEIDIYNTKVFIEDEYRPSLTIDTLSLKLSYFNYFDGGFSGVIINKLFLSGIDLSIYETKDGLINFAKLKKLQTVEEPEKESPPLFSTLPELNCQHFEIRDLSLKWQRELRASPPDEGIKHNLGHNFWHLKTGIVKYEELAIDKFAVKCNFKTAPNFISGVLNQLQFDLPLNDFQLKKASAYFFFSDTQSEILALDAQTSRSMLTLSASIRDVNMFSPLNLEAVKTSPLFFQLSSERLAKADLALFTDKLPEAFKSLAVDIKTKGTLENLDVSKFGLLVGKNRLSLTGSLKKLYEPKKLVVDLPVVEARINVEELGELVGNQNIQAYNYLEPLDLNGSIKGGLDNAQLDLAFDSDFGNGKIQADVSGPSSDNPNWQAQLSMDRLNLAPVLNDPEYQSRLNGMATFSGQGKSLETLNGALIVSLDSSKFSGRRISKLRSTVDIHEKKLEGSLEVLSNRQKIDLQSIVSFNSDKTRFEANGTVKNLNLTSVLLDKNYQSDLNLSFNIQGEGNDLGDLSTTWKVKFDSSGLKGVEIEKDTKAFFSIIQSAEGSSIEVASDIIEVNAYGDFDLNRLKNIGEYETRASLKELNQNNIFRERFSLPNLLGISSENLEVSGDSAFEFPELKLIFDAHLKSPEKIARILQIGDLEAEGTFRGVIQSSAHEMSFKSNAQLESLRFKDKIAALDLKFALNYKDSLVQTEQGVKSRFFNIVSFDADKLKLGNNLLFETNALFDYSDRKLYLNVRTSDKTTGGLFDLETSVSFLNELYDISLKNFSFATSNVLWQLNPNAHIRLSEQEISLENVFFENYNQIIELDGRLNLSGYGEIDVNVKELDLSELRTLIFKEKDKRFEGIVNLAGEIKGTLDDPIINSQLYIDDLAYQNVDIGHLQLQTDYKQQDLLLNLSANLNQERIDSLKLRSYPFNHITLKGSLPVDLSFVSTEERFVRSKHIDVKLSSPNISPKVIEYFLPFFSNSNGDIPVEATVSHNFPNPKILIRAKLKDFVTTVEPSGVTYKINGDLTVTEDEIRPRGVIFEDYSGGKGELSGAVLMDFFDVTGLDLKGTCTRLELLNKPDIGDQEFWGDIVGSSTDLSLTGNLDYPVLRGEMNIDDANYSMLRTGAANASQLAQATRFVNFVPRKDPTTDLMDIYNENINETIYLFEDNDKETEEVYQEKFLDKLRIRDFILKNNRRLTFNVIFDRYSGEKFQTEIPRLLLNVNKTGQNYVANGFVNIASGKYNFATAAFDIQPDAKISWNNINIREGEMENVYANRRLRVSDKENNQIDDVTLSLHIGGTLNDPQVQMGYYLNELSQPYSSQASFGGISSTIDPNAQLNIMTLLFANQWYTKPGSNASFEGNTAISNVGLSTGAGLISAQLSRLASGISGLESVDLNITRDSEGSPVGVDLTVALTVPGTDGRLKLITSGTTSKTELVNQNASYYSNAQKLEYQLTNNLIVEAYRTFGLNRNSVGYGFGDQVSEIWGLSVAYRKDFRTWGELWDRIFKSKSDQKKSELFQSENQVERNRKNLFLSN